MRLPKTRAAARRLGAPTYFTGKPCPREHVAPRLTSSCYCLQCNNDDGYRWNKANRAKRNAYTRKWQGLPEPTRPCPERCECCNRKSKKELALDHDHKTGAFRGWICDRCNLGIGGLGDTIEGVQRGVDYLRRARAA